MHLLFENVGPNLVKLWTGTFKGLDQGDGNYEIDAEVWKEIWEETAAAMKTIPSAFIRSLAGGSSKFIAEAWCFWFAYMAPGLLRGRFADSKYHRHACQFSEIIQTCLKFALTIAEIDELEEKIVDWVEKYEEYYYQYCEARLSTCTLTIHGMLHIANDIRFCGPSWVTWTFYMERYCGFLKHGLSSKRFPWSNLNNRILNFAYLEQLRVRYDLSEELSMFEKRGKPGLSGLGQSQYDRYPRAILRVPYRKSHKPEEAIRALVAKYISEMCPGLSAKKALLLLPALMPRWGNLKIVDGDSIRAA
ncbi:hypothetical protein GGX14DRAFT_168794, partial [Mycena pura]